jgi:NitT/TauT family transport system ATP-binding protein
MVTHDIEEALLLADRMIVLSNRPANVVADMPVERPRGGRDAGWIAEMRIKVEKARMQATLSTGDPT